MADNKKVWQNILIGIVIFFAALNYITKKISLNLTLHHPETAI